MKKRTVYLSIIFMLLLIISIVSAQNISQNQSNSTEPNQSININETLPTNIYWKVKQHFRSTTPCPQDNSIASIREKVNRWEIIKDRITSDDLMKFQKDCRKFSRFTREGIGLKGEIKVCYDYLLESLLSKGLIEYWQDNQTLVYPGTDRVANFRRWIIRECYVREYFKEQFKPQTVKDYNAAYFQMMFDERDQEFLDFIRFKSDFPKGVMDEDAEERDFAPEEILTMSPDEQAKYEIIRNKAGGVISSEKEETPKPSKSMIEIIKEKLGGFFRWFK